MTNSSLDTDTKPWYKQFWPWFIIALPASAVIAGISTVFIAFNNADSLVVDDYYKEGKAINQRVALLKRAREMGLQADLQRLEGNHLFLRFIDKVPPANELLLEFIHPTDSERDFSIALKQTPDGSYQAMSPQATEGRWYLRLSVPDQWLIKTEISQYSPSVQFIPAIP
jgi:hypothetical protein